MGRLPSWLEAVAGRRALDRALARARLPEAVIRDPALRIPLHSMVELFSAAGRESGDPAAGLRIGLGMNGAELGAWLDYGVSAPSLRIGLQRIAWAMPLFQSGPAFALAETAREAVWSYRMPRLRGLDRRHHSDHVLPLIIAFLRCYLGADWLPRRIGLDYPDDGRGTILSDLLPVEWHFGRPEIWVAFDRAGLDRPPVAPPAPELTCEQVRARMQRGAAGALAALEAAILMDLGEERTGIDHAAWRLRLGPRSLQRQLASEGTTYREVLGRVRERQARALLHETDLSVAEIAHRLGYTEPGNFTRAFQAWTGVAPSGFARLCRAG
nr:AraC family transcriptional regulator [Mangrovicoccus algicola]